MTVLAAAALGAALQLAPGATFDGAVPMSLWLEAERTRGSDCGWYLSGYELLADTDAAAGGDGCRVAIRLRGTINPASVAYFRDVAARLTELGARPTRIVLDSRGGDADSAFAIANVIRTAPLFRRDGIATEIATDDTAVCFSACLFLFAAGTERRAEFDIFGNPSLPSRMGIHRPAQYRTADGSFDLDPSNPAVRRVAARMRRYFERVGVDPGIVDAMFAVPFDDIHLITRDEALGYGLIREADLRDD